MCVAHAEEGFDNNALFRGRRLRAPKRTGATMLLPQARERPTAASYPTRRRDTLLRPVLPLTKRSTTTPGRLTRLPVGAVRNSSPRWVPVPVERCDYPASFGNLLFDRHLYIRERIAVHGDDFSTTCFAPSFLRLPLLIAASIRRRASDLLVSEMVIDGIAYDRRGGT